MRKTTYFPIALAIVCLAAGCELPICHENNVICGTSDGDALIIYHSDLCSPDSKCGQMRNQTPCMLYQCHHDNFEALTNGYCEFGSRLENGVLSCVPRCDGLPKQRCKLEDGHTIVQTCTNEGPDMWVTSLCANSCKPDSQFPEYEDDSFKAGSCGECHDDMQPYCDYDADGLVVLSCKNGTLISEHPEPQHPDRPVLCPNNYQTRCPTGYVYTQGDRDNCGGCGIQCSSEEHCIDGICRICNEEGYVGLTNDEENKDQIVRAYCIHNAQQLKEFHDSLAMGKPYPESNTDNVYVLVEDIEYTDEWTPLGTSENPIKDIVLYGQSKKLSFTQPIRGTVLTGVFGMLYNSYLIGVNLVHARIELIRPDSSDKDIEGRYAGGLAGGMIGGKIHFANVNVDIYTTGGAGGIVGISSSTFINNSTVEGTITIDQDLPETGSDEPGDCDNPDGCDDPDDPPNDEPGDCDNPDGCDDPDDPPNDDDPGDCDNPDGCDDPDDPPNDEPGDCNNPDGCDDPDDPPNDDDIKPLPRLPVGGVTAFSNNTTFTNVSSKIRITHQDDLALAYIGGIIGASEGPNTISDSFYTGDIVIPSGGSIGGLIGYSNSSNKTMGLDLHKSYFSGSITIETEDPEKESHSVGGLIGFFIGNGRINITGSYVNGKFHARQNVGGFIGSVLDDDSSYASIISNGNILIESCTTFTFDSNGIQTCYEVPDNDIQIESTTAFGGLIGFLGATYTTKASSIRGIFNLIGTNAKKVGGLIGMTTSTVDISNSILDIGIHVTNENDTEESYGIGGIVGGSQNADISIVNTSGHFDIQADNSFSVGGLFGYASNEWDILGNINAPNHSEFNVYNNRFSGDVHCKYSCAGLIGSVGYHGNDSVLGAIFWSNVFQVMNISGDDEIGLLIGHFPRFSFMEVDENLIRDITIDGNMYVGGITGYNNGTIYMFNNAIDHIDIHGEQDVGGIIGRNESESLLQITQNAIQVNVRGDASNIGGIAGSVDSPSIIKDSMLNVMVEGFHQVGGIAGVTGNAVLALYRTAITGVVAQNRANTAESDPVIFGGLIGNGNNMIGVYDTYSFVRMLQKDPTNIISGVYAGLLNLTNEDYGSLVYWYGAMDEIAMAGPGSTPSNETLMTESIPYIFTESGQAVIPVDETTAYAVADYLQMSECTVRVPTSADDTWECDTLPYPQVLEEISLNTFCIPAERIDEMCASPTPAQPDIPEDPAPDDAP